MSSNNTPEKNIPPSDDATWVDADDTPAGLVHNVYVPPDASLGYPAPVVVMVHGRQGNEAVTWLFRRSLPDTVAVVSPRAPIHVAEKSYDWFRYANHDVLEPDSETLKEGLDKLGHFIESLPEVYPVDPDHLVLLGFSQGAMMVNSYLMAHPGRAIGLASLAGFLAHTPNVIEERPNLPGFPVFIAHGTRDETVPIRYARETRDIYQELGADVSYGEYDVGHKVHTDGLKAMKAWFNALL